MEQERDTPIIGKNIEKIISTVKTEKFSPEQRLEYKLTRQFNHAVRENQLIEENDKVLIGLSGGKDSLALMEFLSRKSKISHPHFSITALHVRMKNIAYESDISYLTDFAANCGVQLIVKETQFDPSTDSRKSPCFLCSWNRRKELFNTAQELGCNKIALGHHQDDILHTALLNLFYQGQFNTMPALLQMRKFPLTIIRPLCFIHECDLIEWAKLRGYKKQKKNCPYENDSHRTDIRNLFNQLEQTNPEIRYSLWHALVEENKLIERIDS